MKDIKINFNVTVLFLICFTFFASLLSFSIYASDGTEVAWYTVLFDLIRNFDFSGANAGSIGLLVSQAILAILKETTALDGLTKGGKRKFIAFFNAAVAYLTITVIGGIDWIPAIWDAAVWAAIQTFIYEVLKKKETDHILEG